MREGGAQRGAGNLNQSGVWPVHLQDQENGAGLDSWHGRTAVLNYVSLGSLTGVGSGAVVPVRPPATVLTTLETVFGQFYIAVVVAQLVGARLSQEPKQNGSPET